MLITFPVLGENVLTLLVGWSDTILTGRLLPEAKYLAAVTFCSYLCWLIDCFGYLASIGAQTLISQFTGAGKPAQANKILVQSLLIAGTIGALILLTVWLSSDYWLKLLPLSNSAQLLVAQYLRIVAISYPLMLVMQVGCTSMQAAGYTLPAMWIMAVTNLINITCSWFLATNLGSSLEAKWCGIALGTAISFISAGILTLYWLHKGVGHLQLSSIPVPDFKQISRILKIGSPGALNWLLMTVCYLLHLSIVGSLGDSAVAAHGVAVWCESLSWSIGQSFSIAAATLVGQCLGANKPELARNYGWLTLYIGGSCMCLMGVIFFTSAPSLLAIFVDTEQTQVLTQGIPVLQLIAFAQPPLAAATILTWALEGGAGDTRWPLIYNLVGRLLVEIPLTYALTGAWINLGLYGAWLALLVNAYVQGIAAIWRFSSSSWAVAKI